jgi:hypothetical protein
MPTIPQLPPATTTGAQDELPVSQEGITRSVTVSELLSGTQPAIEIPSGDLLGRISLGPGGPEAVQLGLGLEISAGIMAADGGDHAFFSAETALDLTDEAILNSSGNPVRLPLPLLRGLFSAGLNIAIGQAGSISAETDPTVESELGSLTSGLATTNANLAALAALVPTGGYVALNAQGQMTAPVAGPVTLGTVSVASGAPERTLGAMSVDIVNVLDFGALTNGSDCTAAFNAAFNAIPATGGDLFIPAGDYHFMSPLVWGSKPLTMRGAGKGQTRLHLQHTGIGFDFAQTNPLNRIILRDFSAFAESSTGQTAAVAQISFPQQTSFGYISAFISDIECFGYPNGGDGVPPFPQTFLRGIVLNNCWSTQVNNVSWFGPPAAAGATNSAAIELNGSIDTRISGLQAYFGQAAILQTGICQGIYIANPVIVGTDYLISQTDITTWPGYTSTKIVLLGLWVSNGEVNTNLGAAQLTNAAIGLFFGLDITRNGGPNVSQTLFDLTNVSSYWIVGCNFIGGPSGGNNQDVAIEFVSTFNSSNNTIGACRFANLATVLKLGNGNATVGLTTFALNPGNVPASTAFIDNSAANVNNYISFQSLATSTAPAGIANTKDHVFAAADGSTLFQISSVLTAANHIRHLAAASGNSPTIIFEGTDGTVNGVIQTRGGNLIVNASGGGSGSGNLVSLLNVPGAVNWPELQNATSGNLSQLTTNAGGLGLQPKGGLFLSPSNGVFAPGLPTIKPAAGSSELWNDNGVVSIA